MKKTQNSLNEAYDELNIPEEESIIDLKIVRQSFMRERIWRDSKR